MRAELMTTSATPPSESHLSVLTHCAKASSPEVNNAANMLALLFRCCFSLKPPDIPSAQEGEEGLSPCFMYFI